MSRSTRSSARKSHTDDSLIEDGFSVVDTDKTQKRKEGQAKTDSTPSQSQEEIVGDGGDQNAQMEVDQNNSIAGVGGDEAQNTENGIAEGEEKPNEGGETGTANEEGKTGEETGENQEKKEGEEGKEKKSTLPKHPVVWVSNMPRHIKASDLKKHFSNHGKVVTAKIVTNGRSYFGYVCLDSLEAVEACVTNLNDSELEGRKITVTVEKPVRDDRILRKKAEGGPKDPLTTVYDDSDTKSDKDRTDKGNFKKRDTSEMTAEDLRKEIGLCEREIDRLRTRLIEEQARGRDEMQANRRLERKLESAEMKMRDERRRHDRDREDWARKNEDWSKKTRLEQLRFDANRAIIERESQELRRAREDFERDLRRFLEEQRTALERPRGGSPPHNAKRFRPDDGPVDGGSSWISEPVNTGPPRDNPGPGRGGSQFFSSWNNQGGGSGSGGSQWRSMGSGSGGGGGSGQPPFLRGGGGQGGSFGGSGEGGGFRSSQFDGPPSRKFL